MTVARKHLSAFRSMLFKPTASASLSVSRSTACKSHSKASREMLHTAADCGKLQVPTTTNPTMSVLAAMSINASIPTFSFCGITNNEIPQGVLLRFYSRPCDTPLTDTSTNLTHSHSPGLGCSSGPMPSTAPFFWGRRQGALALK